MKSAELRDAMVNAVQTAYASYPTFLHLPVNEDPSITIVVELDDPADQEEYIRALYQLCSSGVAPVGRRFKQIVGA